MYLWLHFAKMTASDKHRIVTDKGPPPPPLPTPTDLAKLLSNS